MNKQEILNSKGFKYISSLSGAQRHSALFGSSRSAIEKAFNVKIEERPFADLLSIPETSATLSVTDPFRNIAFIAVLTPL